MIALSLWVGSFYLHSFLLAIVRVLATVGNVNNGRSSSLGRNVIAAIPTFTNRAVGKGLNVYCGQNRLA
jgi:hypothetical protein